jgi:hypothetical protein
VSRPKEPDVCDTCIHFLRTFTDPPLNSRVSDLSRWRCEAFPNGMPDAIMYDEFDHHDPFPGDHGMQYQAADE